MAAYSAVVSFEQVLKQLLNSNEFPPDFQKTEIQFLHENLCSLQSSVEKILPAPKEKRGPASDLERKIRDAVYEAQDMVESFILVPDRSWAAISLEKAKTEIAALAKQAKQLADSIDRKTSPASLQTSEFDFVSLPTKIVGQEKDKKRIQEELRNKEDKLQVVPISGMAGIGKTTLARSIYEDEDIKKYFLYRAWVTVTQDYNVAEILSKLSSSMRLDDQPIVRSSGSQQQASDKSALIRQIRQDLYQKRFLIVVDDMWGTEVWDEVKHAFQDDRTESRIILTTRYAEVADYAKGSERFHHKMQTLDENNSWVLLSHVAFRGNTCPDDGLKKIGNKITNSCGGLPLSITVVGGLLSVPQAERRKEYWTSIAEDVNAAVGSDPVASESYKKILSLSYIHLPGWLKGCFLYMGLFPEDSEIHVSKIIQLWTAEGFLHPPDKSASPLLLEDLAKRFLKNLIDRNLISVRKSGSDRQIKACGLHDTLRDLAVDESRDEKFFHSIRKYNQELKEAEKDQRRVSVHKNILMCLEKVYESAKSIENARSLLYVGPHHHHPLPSNLTFKLLRVLDAFTVYFSGFPGEITKLIHLRYLSLTYNAKIPSSISQLEKLQILIVRRQPKIVFVGASFLPDEIWKLADLRHLLFTETDLPDLLAGQETILLANLQSLSNVRAVSCTKEVLRNTPNLTKLGMWLEEPREVGFYVDQLNLLDSFKFTVLNPIPGTPVEFKPALVFPESLRKLTLSGCGLPWEDLEVIRQQLPNLEVLKLRELAFDGEEWIMEEDAKFRKLKFLLLEYLNFKIWGVDDTYFPKLERLIIKHCYELEDMDTALGDIGELQLIEVVDCSREAVLWVEEIRETQEKKKNKDLKFTIHSSWK